MRYIIETSSKEEAKALMYAIDMENILFELKYNSYRSFVKSKDLTPQEEELLWEYHSKILEEIDSKNIPV